VRALLRRFAPLPLLATVAVAALAVLACGADRRPVRLVVITLDTLRYDGLAPGEEGVSRMPGLLGRARDEGLFFERFYAATSVTQPSHASMFTALHPWEHGVVSNGQILRADFTTVAERLQEEGFATGGIVASFPLAGRFGFAQGFDDFTEDFVEQPVEWRKWEGHEVPDATFYSLADTITDHALGLFDRLGEREDGDTAGQFVWVHYFDPHDPYGDTDGGETYTPFSAFREIEAGNDASYLFPVYRERYDADLAVLDQQLERLFRRFEAEADRYRTHVVITSDHGESFGEDGAIAHGLRITDEQIHVPLVILSPDLEPAVRGDVAGSIDVATTLLSLAGVAHDTEPWSQGRDLTRPPPLAGEVDPATLDLRRATFGMRRTFRGPNKVETRADGERVLLPRFHFYAVDRAGTVYRGNHEGLVGGEPEDERLLGQLLSAFAAFERQAVKTSAPTADDPETREALRALGYLD
jgi:arylsulfatase A-like enzyme